MKWQPPDFYIHLWEVAMRIWRGDCKNQDSCKNQGILHSTPCLSRRIHPWARTVLIERYYRADTICTWKAESPDFCMNPGFYNRVFIFENLTCLLYTLGYSKIEPGAPPPAEKSCGHLLSMSLATVGRVAERVLTRHFQGAYPIKAGWASAKHRIHWTRWMKGESF